jgi:undecaprenyl-diphosphatase
MNLFELNEKIFFFINQKMANSFLDNLVLFVLIPLFSFLVLVPIYFLFKGKKFLAVYALFCGFFLYWFGHAILKPIFNIPRPFVLFEKVRTIGPWHGSPYSFPSTTTMLAFGLALPIFLKERKIGTFLLILALLVGFSVIYTGFHTPFDVLGSILFSLIFVLIFDKFLSFKEKNQFGKIKEQK